MLLGLATILAGSLARNDPDISEPTFVGLILGTNRQLLPTEAQPIVDLLSRNGGRPPART